MSSISDDATLTVLPRVPIERNRFTALERRSTGRDVLHVGCADVGLLEERLESGQLLHLRLGRVARSLAGIDVDKDAIELLRSKGIANLFVADVCETGWGVQLRDTPTDLILVSEVIEHLSNPGFFLDQLAEFALARSAEAIFTVPSPFGLEVLRRLLRNTEFVHPDHNYWFSYHTILTLLSKHGWNATEIATYSFEDRRLLRPIADALQNKRSVIVAAKWGVRAALNTPRRMLAGFLESRSPFFSEGLIVVAAPRESPLPRATEA